MPTGSETPLLILKNASGGVPCSCASPQSGPPPPPQCFQEPEPHGRNFQDAQACFSPQPGQPQGCVSLCWVRKGPKDPLSTLWTLTLQGGQAQLVPLPGARAPGSCAVGAGCQPAPHHHCQEPACQPAGGTQPALPSLRPPPASPSCPIRLHQHLCWAPSLWHSHLLPHLPGQQGQCPGLGRGPVCPGRTGRLGLADPLQSMPTLGPRRRPW